MTGAGRSISAAASEMRAPIDHNVGCTTCGDLAIWMRVLGVEHARELAVCVDEEGRRQRIDTGIVGAVAPGDTLLVHAGAALVRETSV